MIGWTDLHRAAVQERTLLGDETERRRAVSALYYALFHRLSALGAAVFVTGGPELQTKVRRAFNHGLMKSVCELYLTASKKGQFAADLSWQPSASPSQQLAAIASAFIQLQQGRHPADYDLAADLSAIEHLRLLLIAEDAHRQLDQLGGSPDLTIFVSALLLHDRWKRNG